MSTTPDTIPEETPHPENRSAQQLGLGPLGLAIPRASNEARAALAVANVTPTGYRVGVFLANHARHATDADQRRKVSPGEIFCYWPQAKIADDLGCSVRQVKRGIRSLREAGVITVRQRVRPCEASYVWARPVPSGVTSGVPSDVPSHTEPRTNHKRTPSEPFQKGERSGTRTSVPQSPVKTAAPMKGSPLPSTQAATTEEPAGADVLRAIRQQFTAARAKSTKHKGSKRPVSAPEADDAPTFKLDPDLEARFEEQDRLLHEHKAKTPPPPTPAVGCPDCGHDRLMGGSCDQCGYDDGTHFSPNPDKNEGL